MRRVHVLHDGPGMLFRDRLFLYTCIGIFHTQSLTIDAGQSRMAIADGLSSLGNQHPVANIDADSKALAPEAKEVPQCR